MEKQDNRTAYQKVGTAIAWMCLKGSTFKFYGYMGMQLGRTIDPSISTMALCYNHATMKPELLINEEFVHSLSMPEIRAVAMHEIMHLINRHCQRRETREQQKFNIAADMAANYIINKETQHKENIVLPENTIKPIEHAKHQTMEYYYDILDSGKNKDVDGQYGLIDSHEKWTTFESVPEEVLNEELLSMIDLASQMAGDTPGSVTEAIKGLLQPSITWEHYLRAWVGNNTRIGTKPTWHRPSRRIRPIIRKGFIQQVAQGRRWKRSACIGVVLDTSGSVSSTDLVQFMTEINTMSKTHKIIVTEVDTEAHEPYVYDSRMYEQFGRDIQGRGGTDMNPGLKIMNEYSEVEFIIVLTDGELFHVPDPPHKHELWVITSNGTTRYVEDKHHTKMQHTRYTWQ